MNGDIRRLLDIVGWTPHGTVGKFTSKCINLQLTASFPYSNPESPLQSASKHDDGSKIHPCLHCRDYFIFMLCSLSSCCAKFQTEPASGGLWKKTCISLPKIPAMKVDNQQCKAPGIVITLIPGAKGLPFHSQSLLFRLAGLHQSSILQTDAVS